MKDGKLYRVGADGKLYPYDGELKPGDIVWKDGKPYVVGADGKLHPIGDKPQPGDIVEKDGKLYQVGEDGKLYPYAGELTPGQVIWKDGKPYMVDENGNLVPLKEGMVRTIDGKPYVWKDGQWVPLSELGAKPKHLVVKDNKLYEIGDDGTLSLFKGKLKPGDIVWKDGVPYVVGDDGKLHKMADGQRIKDKDGYHYIYKDQKLQREEDNKPQDKAAIDHPDEPRAGYDQSLMAAYKSSLVSFDGDSEAKGAKGDASAQQSPQDRVQEALNSQMTALREQAKAMSSVMTKGSDQYAQQNSQSSKIAFLKEDQSEPDQSDATLKHPVSPYTLFAGSVIPATFETGINSDLPGTIIARVSRNVYDTRTGNYLLIPQGTKIMGKYDSQVAYGQERVLMVFTRLLFPNGTSIKLDNQPGADLRGFAGVTGDVNNHYWRIFGNALMFSVFGALGQLSQPSGDNSNGNGTSNQQVIYAAIGQQLTQTAAQMLAKNMNIQPTIKIQPGNNFSILTTRDIVFPSWYRFDNPINSGDQA
ncbi:TrbI/VirB10 family protein [Cysteiniphilum sp. 6C5]|uniref:TrbI/VirB10 family protein n=1 Tax=unclassified Cysteiniphilum TaxID=2610889 RepID=UPI003F85ED23